LSKDILKQYTISDETFDLTGNGNIVKEGGECDQLLQQFHRFDESLSIQGKWQGGSVTGVCRGFGTSKVREGS